MGALPSDYFFTGLTTVVSTRSKDKPESKQTRSSSSRAPLSPTSPVNTRSHAMTMAEGATGVAAISVPRRKPHCTYCGRPREGHQKLTDCPGPAGVAAISEQLKLQSIQDANKALASRQGLIDSTQETEMDVNRPAQVVQGGETEIDDSSRNNSDDGDEQRKVVDSRSGLGINVDVGKVTTPVFTGTNIPATAENTVLLIKEKVANARRRRTYTIPLSGGSRVTPGGNAKMDLYQSGQRKKKYATQQERTENALDLFQSVAQKADVLAWRSGGYALVYYIPPNDESFMREWVSEDVMEHIPETRDTIRKVLFDAVHDRREDEILQRRKKRINAQRELDKADARARKHTKVAQAAKKTKAKE